MMQTIYNFSSSHRVILADPLTQLARPKSMQIPCPGRVQK